MEFANVLQVYALLFLKFTSFTCQFFLGRYN